MNSDLRNRVRHTHLAASHYLMPVFEAIVNSIQSIEEADIKDGKIDIFVERATEQLTLDPAEVEKEPVNSFVIVDNGAGFNELNYESFKTADTAHKLAKGGKGVGRLLWLKAFTNAEIESHYLNADGEMFTRKFTFLETEEGVEKPTNMPSDQTTPITTVRLENYKEPYRDHCPRGLATIALRIIEHCLSYFALETCPVLVLHELQTGKSMNLRSVFETEIKISEDVESFKVHGEPYSITHYKFNITAGTGQKVTFCADQRALLDEHLLNNISGIPARFKDDEGTFVYVGYVSSPHLDRNISIDRSQFNLPKRKADPSLNLDITWEDIFEESTQRSERYLEKYLRPARESNLLRIREYIYNKAPQYRPLLNHKLPEIRKIPPLPDEKLEIELFRLHTVYAGDLKTRFEKLLTKAQSASLESLHSEIRGFVDEWNEAGKAQLADHVAYRRATLKLLSKIIHREEGAFAHEKTIHNLVFPMRLDSDHVVAENVNLWIIDERLAYHGYLGSDIPFDQMKNELVVEGEERPDLLIFKNANAFLEPGKPPTSVVIVEFKRPMRGDFSEHDNPITQVHNYIDRIKSGHAVDAGGRRIPVPDGVPFYAYIVTDITANLEKFALRATLKPTWDKEGFFGFHDSYNCYFEIIGFAKLVRDAEQRNSVLFEKLGIR